MSGHNDGKPYEGLFRDRRARLHFWGLFILISVILACTVIPVIGSFWDARNRRNSPERTSGTPSMQNEQQRQDDHRKERPVTIFIVPIHKNENGCASRDTAKNGEDQATCACGDDLIQIRVSSGDMYQPGVSGAIERKD